MFVSCIDRLNVCYLCEYECVLLLCLYDRFCVWRMLCFSLYGTYLCFCEGLRACFFVCAGVVRFCICLC